jgi:hypothetical protein
MDGASENPRSDESVSGGLDLHALSLVIFLCASKESNPPAGEVLFNSEAGQAVDVACPLFCI